MAHFLLCFRPLRSDSEESGAYLVPVRILGRSASRGTQQLGFLQGRGSLPRLSRTRQASGQDVTHASSSDSGVSQEAQRTVAFVELLKHRNEPLGLVLKGGADCNLQVFVGQLHPGGVAQKSGALQIGDHIRGINGTATDHLNENEANALLRNSGNVINLEIEFEAPPGSDIDSGTMKKTAQVRLRKERNGFGFTINGGRTEDRPITVSNVIVGSFAYKNGFLKAGDRVLKVNSNDVSKSTLMEALSFLKASEDVCTLEIEYDVTIHEGLSEYTGQLMIELLKPKGATLGMTLRDPFNPGSPLVISKLKEAGIADRCGALHIGDRLLSVNKESLEGKSIADVYRLLRRCDLNVELKIIPTHNFTPPSPSASQRAAENLSETASAVSRPAPPHSQRSTQDTQSMVSFSSLGTSHVHTTHPETMVVQLEADEIGYGLSLQGGATDRGIYPLVITAIDGGGPAAKLGQLQVGDQVLGINGIKMAGYSLQEALKLVQEADNEIELEVMYEVQDATSPSSGTFDVHLKKTCSLNLGITINGSVSRGDTIWISSLKKGGVAYRSGMLHSGDAILAINDQSLERCNLRDAAHILKNTGESVVLKIAKASCTPPSASASVSETVIYSVELHRNQKSLGITLTGSSDQPGHPVVISKVKENGVAHKTGALKAGDRVLAINGESLYNKTLHEALRMLNAAGETVSLKISKARRKHKLRHKSGSPTSKLRGLHSGSPIYHRDSFGSSGSSLLGASRQGLAGHSSYCGTRGHCFPRSLNNFEPSRFSYEPPGGSVSAYYTPDPNAVSGYPPPLSSSLYVDPREARGGRMNLECSTTCHSPNSDLSRSAFIPTGSGMYGMSRPHNWNGSYMGPGSVAREEDRLSSSGFSPGRNRRMPHSYSHLLDHQLSAELQYMIKHRQLMDRGVSGGGASKRDSSTDDEVSVYEPDGKVPKYRRTELTDRSLYLNQRQSRKSSRADEGGRMWDFKTRGHASKGHIPIGRVSPITPTETERASVTSLYSHQNVKNLLKLKVDQEPCQASSQDCASTSSTVHAPSKDGEEKEEGERLQGEEVCTEAEQTVACAHSKTPGTMLAQSLSTSLQDGGSRQDGEDEEVGEPPPSPQLVASPHASPVVLNTAPRPRSISPEVVSEADAVIDEPFSSPHELPAPTSNETRPPQESSKSSRNGVEGDEGASVATEVAKGCCTSPTGRHCRNSLTSELVIHRADPVDISSSSFSSPSAALVSSPSLGFSPLRRSSSSHRPTHTVNSSPSLQSAIHKRDIVVTESRLRHRDRLDHSPSRWLESSSPLCTKIDSGKSLKLAPTLSEFKKTIDNADKFGRAMAALAESGSSDQDSDSEPRSKLAVLALPHESAKVTEKMRITQSYSGRQKVIIRKNPGEMSFGFSIADGQYDLGVYVKTIKLGGPSDRAGLLQYDKIIKVNEVLLMSEHTLPSICALLKRHERELVLIIARQT